MPSGFATLDTNFPKLDGMSNEQRIQTLTSYLYQLLENLRYVLNNLGEENINESDWEKITNAAVFTALGQEGATIINGGNISTGTIDASKVSVENIDAHKITVGELDGVNIRGVNVYGAQYFDENAEAKLDISSMEGFKILMFGEVNMSGLANSVFGVYKFSNSTTGHLYLGGGKIMIGGMGSNNPFVQALGNWSFEDDIQLPAGSQYPTRTEVQAMIDASIAAANGGA